MKIEKTHFFQRRFRGRRRPRSLRSLVNNAKRKRTVVLIIDDITKPVLKVK